MLFLLLDVFASDLKLVPGDHLYNYENAYWIQMNAIGHFPLYLVENLWQL